MERAFIYGSHKVKKDFIIFNLYKIGTNIIKEVSEWMDKVFDLTIKRKGIFVLWFDDIDELSYRVAKEDSENLGDAHLIVGSESMTCEIKEKLESKENTIACFSFDEIFNIIQELL